MFEQIARLNRFRAKYPGFADYFPAFIVPDQSPLAFPANLD
jgi:hypothetical protein